ncbi:uncharacterized protein LOC113500703 isoform X2 [Trichoplusia ni]|uniref:Uncharacterized protein LOC113500703 isoform X2 n=1 Tax=Trichoplusia ni TaxID=7111 RepID=A0A7E5WB17_TRINI|nr:uncharacterized protein LOC113500703 isoform X2 [Trichoplusia ni]
MKILVIISSILIAQTSASFFDVFQGAVLTVQNSFGKMISDVVSDVKETVDCTILAVEHALALSEDAALRYYEKCGNTINNTVTVTETRHIESSPQVDVSPQYPSDDYLKKEIPAVIDAKINETLTKMLGNYNPSEKLRDVESVLVKETEQLANVSDLVRKELKKVESEVKSDLKNLTHLHPEPLPSVDSIMQEIKLLENKEQSAVNNSQATEIHRVIDEVLVRLDNIEATESTENVKLERILKDLEQNSNSSFIDLRQQLESWKAEESRHIDDIQTKILEHERNAHPETHNNTFKLLPPGPYDSDIRQMNVKEVNITSTKRMSNVSRDISSFETSVNAKNEQSHTLTLTKPKANNTPGNLSGVSSTSTSLKISQTTPDVSNDSDLKITVISSKSYSVSKSVSIRGKVPPADSTTSNNQRSVHLTTDQTPTTIRLGNTDHNLRTIFFGSTTESTPVSDLTISSTDMPIREDNTKIVSNEEPSTTTSIPNETAKTYEFDSTTEHAEVTEIEAFTSSLSDSTTTSSYLVTEQSLSTEAISMTGQKEISDIKEEPTTIEFETAISDTTTQRFTETENNPDDILTTTGKEESLTLASETTTSLPVNQHSIDDNERTITTDTPIAESTVSETRTTNSHTARPPSTSNALDNHNVQTTTSNVNKDSFSETSTEHGIKSYEVLTTGINNDIASTTSLDLMTVKPSEGYTEQSTTLHVEETTPSVTILNSEYINTVISATADLTTEVVSESTTEQRTSTTLHGEEITTALIPVTTMNPDSIDVTPEINNDQISDVGVETTTDITLTTLNSELTTDNHGYNTEQSTTPQAKEVSSVTTVNVETTTDFSTNLNNAHTTMSDETETSENHISTTISTQLDLTTETVSETSTQISATTEANLTTNKDIETTTESDVVTENSSERHIEQRTTTQEDVLTDVNDIPTVTTPNLETTVAATTETVAHRSSNNEAEPTINVKVETTTHSDVDTESPTENHNEQKTTPYEEVTTSVNDVSSVITSKSDDTLGPVTETINEQSTIKEAEPTTNVNIDTTSHSDVDTESPTEHHIEQSTTPNEEVATIVSDISVVTTPKPQTTTEALTEAILQQSTTNEAELATNVNFATTIENYMVTENTFDNHNVPSTTPFKQVTTSVNDISTGTTLQLETTTESIPQETTTAYEEVTTESPEKTNNISTTLHAEEVTTVEPITTATSDLTTEYNSQTHTESNTAQNHNLNEDVASDRTTAADTITEHQANHVHIKTSTNDGTSEDLTTVKPTTENASTHEFSDAPIATTSNAIIESTTESQIIQTHDYDSESLYAATGFSEHTTTSIPDIITTSIPLTTTESPYESKDYDLPRTSTRSSRRTRKRNSTRSGRRRNATSIATEIPITPTIQPPIPIALQILPITDDHVHSNPHILLENSYVPHQEMRLPARRIKRPVLSEAHVVNTHEIELSNHKIEETDGTINYPSLFTDNNDDSRKLHELNEAPKAIEHRRINRDTLYTNPDNVHEPTTPRQQRLRRNRNRRLDQTTESSKPVREITTDLINPANRRRGNRRRANRQSNEQNESAYRSTATTSKPVQHKNNYDISPADYDALFNIPPRNSEAHVQNVARAHELIANSKRNELIINSILQHKKLNGARNLFDVLG